MKKFDAAARKVLYRDGVIFLEGRRFDTVRSQVARYDSMIVAKERDGGVELVLVKEKPQSIRSVINCIADSLGVGESADIPDDLISPRNEKSIRVALYRRKNNDCLIVGWTVFRLDPDVPFRSRRGIVYYAGENLGYMTKAEFEDMSK